MKRDPHLLDLSRDHHHALVLARRAETTAADGTAAEVVGTVAGFWVAAHDAAPPAAADEMERPCWLGLRSALSRKQVL